MPFLTDQADEQDEPHRRRDVQVGAGEPQQHQPAAERQRRRQQDQQRRQPGAELGDEDHEHEEAGEREHEEQLPERRRLVCVLAADFVGVADRQRQPGEPRADLVDGAAEIALLEARR